MDGVMHEGVCRFDKINRVLERESSSQFFRRGWEWKTFLMTSVIRHCQCAGRSKKFVSTQQKCWRLHSWNYGFVGVLLTFSLKQILRCMLELWSLLMTLVCVCNNGIGNVMLTLRPQRLNPFKCWSCFIYKNAILNVLDALERGRCWSLAC